LLGGLAAEPDLVCNKLHIGDKELGVMEF